MNVISKRSSVLIFLLITLLIIVSCSRKTLNIFFDGVPPEIDSTLLVENIIPEKELDIDSLNFIALAPVDPMTYHYPFVEKECASCHDQNSMGKYTSDQPDLCYMCHEDFSDLYGNLHAALEFSMCTDCHHPHKSKNDFLLKEEMPGTCFMCHDDFTGMNYVHDPVTESCSNCHNPHGSNNGFLLIAEEEGFCYNCHEDFTVNSGSLHAPVEMNMCTECHSPHASEHSGLVKEEGQSLCYICHEDFSSMYKMLHAPVEGGMCLDCHSPHNSEQNRLLNMEEKELCFMCHDNEDISWMEMHDGLEDMSCSECHNPHGSDESGLLK